MSFFWRPAETSNLSHSILHALPWILEAGNPYYDVLFGGAASTLTNLQKWTSRDSSEVSIRRADFLMSDSGMVGGFIALGGRTLRNARRADSVALLTSVAPVDRPALALRLKNLSALMALVGDDEYYLSKLGVARQFRGRGLAHVLVARYLGEGARLGYSRFRLDVHAENEAAIRCYRSAGFEMCRYGQSQDGRLKYCSMNYEAGHR